MLIPGLDVAKVSAEVESVADELRQEKERKYTVYGAGETGKLSLLGISGPAVKPKLDGQQDWLNILRETQQAYDLRLNEVREKLSRLMADEAAGRE